MMSDFLTGARKLKQGKHKEILTLMSGTNAENKSGGDKETGTWMDGWTGIWMHGWTGCGWVHG